MSLLDVFLHQTVEALSTHGSQKLRTPECRDTLLWFLVTASASDKNKIKMSLEERKDLNKALLNEIGTVADTQVSLKSNYRAGSDERYWLP